MQNFNRKNWGNDRLGTSLENINVRVWTGFFWLMLRSSGGLLDLSQINFFCSRVTVTFFFIESSSTTDLLIYELGCCLEGSESEIFFIVFSYPRVNSAILYETGNFYVYGSVHRWSMFVIVQWDATQSSLFIILQVHSTSLQRGQAWSRWRG